MAMFFMSLILLGGLLTGNIWGFLIALAIVNAYVHAQSLR